jgi:hypothetical protein
LRRDLGFKGLEAITETEGMANHQRAGRTRSLFDRGQRLAGHPSEGLNFSFQGDRLGCEA